MKRKRNTTTPFNMLKWHTLIFAAAMFLVWYSMVATLTYTGNELVPLDVFKPLILQRVDFTLVWGIALLIHFGVRQVRDYQIEQRMSSTSANVYEDDEQQMQFM